MATLRQITEFIDSIAPFDTAMSWDNSGLLVENDCEDIKNITVCLDITQNIVKKAAEDGTQLIISHHPVIFSPIKRIGGDSVVRLLARHNIAALCAHTNLDISSKGVNTALANALELENITAFDGDDVIGVWGDLKKPLCVDEACRYIKEKLSSEYVMLIEAQNKDKTDTKVSRIAMCSGAGFDFISQAKKCGAQIYLTGEAKHNELLEASAGDTDLVLAGHFATERVVVKPLADMINEKFPDCNVKCADDTEPVKIF